MAHDVFISYSAKDRTAADAVCAALESEGIRCWIAPRDILPGIDWSESIIEAIERARIFVLVFSAAANNSPQIHREVERAINRGVPILPLRIEDARPSRALEYFIGNVAWLDAMTPPLEAHLRRLASRIKMQLDRVEMPLGAMPAEAAMPCAPAPPPMPSTPRSSRGGGLFRGLAGLFRRSASVPAAPPQATHAPSAPSPRLSETKPAATRPGSEPEKATHPSGPVARVSSSTNSGASRKTSDARVDFSVYAPSPVHPSSSFLLNVWACLPGQRAEMVERAAGSSRKVEVGSRGGILLSSETPLLLRLRLDGLTVDNPMEPFAWHGQVTNVSFLVSAPAQLAPGAYPGEVQLLDGGMLIGRFYFEITVGPAQAAGATPPASQAELRAEWMRSAFASYASPDREKVVQRVQGMTAAGVNVYLDVASLRTGHAWQQQLLRAIESADVFYLFWSRFAKASEHVEREWRAALDKKGLAFIHPIPLEDPRKAQPPDELSSLHFNDIYLAILKTSTPSDSPANGPS